MHTRTDLIGFFACNRTDEFQTTDGIAKYGGECSSPTFVRFPVCVMTHEVN